MDDLDKRTDKKQKELQKNIEDLETIFKMKNIKTVDTSNLTPHEKLTKLKKQMDEQNIKSVIEDEKRNIIKDKKYGAFTLRQQVLHDFPPKQLSKILDQGKKDIKKGIIVAFAIDDEEGKIGVAVGITKELTDKYDAVKLVKVASDIIGGKGGGGRKDFAQAGGTYKDKIEDAFKAVSKKIN